MRIGIFGGSFNPVHIGHVAISVRIIEQEKLDQLFVIPASVSPFKKQGVDPKHRLALCRRAFKDVPHCNVLSLEIARGGTSYTIDTIHELFKKGYVTAKDTLFLVLGEDAWNDIPKWKASKEILQLATPLVVERSHFDVSSTEIRKRLKKRLYCGHLLKDSVYTYIRRHRLYQ